MTEPGPNPAHQRRDPPAPDSQCGVDRLLGVVARLRSSDGCPWDREQTLQSLKQHVIEEAYELVDAVETGEPSHHKEELGDLLLQIALQAQIRQEEGLFTFDDVAHGLADKLIRRHPHVFGTTKVSGTSEVLRNWEAIKSNEGDSGKRSAVAGIPRHLPALFKAQRIQSRASRVGFDWGEPGPVLAKVEEELAEIKEALAHGDPEAVAGEIGDLLFSVVNLCRFHSIRAEDALEKTTAKFVRRFQEVERTVRESGRELSDCSLKEMDTIWDRIKKEENEERPTESSDAEPAAESSP